MSSPPAPRRFVNKTAIVTGGGTGIGRATALRLGAEGADVLIVGRREKPLIESANEIAEAGGTAWVHVADVSDETQVIELMAAAVDRWEHIDVLVNNAGIAEEGKFLELTLESWRRVNRVNVDSAFLMGQAVARAQAARAYQCRQYGLDGVLRHRRAIRRLPHLETRHDGLDASHGGRTRPTWNSR